MCTRRYSLCVATIPNGKYSIISKHSSWERFAASSVVKFVHQLEHSQGFLLHSSLSEQQRHIRHKGCSSLHLGYVQKQHDAIKGEMLWLVKW